MEVSFYLNDRVEDMIGMLRLGPFEIGSGLPDGYRLMYSPDRIWRFVIDASVFYGFIEHPKIDLVSLPDRPEYQKEFEDQLKFTPKSELNIKYDPEDRFQMMVAADVNRHVDWMQQPHYSRSLDHYLIDLQGHNPKDGTTITWKIDPSSKEVTDWHYVGHDIIARAKDGKITDFWRTERLAAAKRDGTLALYGYKTL